MKRGPATKKMAELVGGEQMCEIAMNVYSFYKPLMRKDSAAETILTELVRIYKSLQTLRKRGYLTDESEQFIYDAILTDVNIYEKPQILLDLILRVHSKTKTGSTPDTPLAMMIFILKMGHNEKAPKKPFWPILREFLEEQEIIEFEDKGNRYAKKKNDPELKSHYQRYVKQLQYLADQPKEKRSVQPEESNPYKSFIDRHRLYDLINSIQRLPVSERIDIARPFLHPGFVRQYVSRQAKK